MILHTPKFGIDTAQPIDISLPVQLNGYNPNCYYAEQPTAQVITFGDSFVGSVAAGGSCNYQRLHITPHGNGTHTECYGHITAEPVTIHECLRQFLFTARLISLQPQPTPNGDLCIFPEQLEEAMSQNTPEALIVRTLPNTEDKKTRHYSGTNPPYFHPDCGLLLAAKGVQHLLCDLPSVDKEQDGGKLLMHRNFWQYPQATRRHCTITELIYVPNHIPDGAYVLQLNIISLMMDASPSKPILYALIPQL
ncbi:MAG: cyclase family protein [Cytophagales bacterium]|nr:cyclase family protein [Bernardetiaceae bacterium]MDW8203952.1 cyclase family protein [Cytophagales bacterium]